MLDKKGYMHGCGSYDAVAEENMKKASLLAVLLVLIAMSFAAITILPERGRAATIYVGGTGPGNYTMIQAAIDDAYPGDLLYVYSGTYDENVRINKTLTLVGENRSTTTINGNYMGDVVYVTADWVNITGFSLVRSGFLGSDAAVRLHYVHGCNITDNILTDNVMGIFSDQSTSNSMMNNTVLNNLMYGISLGYSNNNSIANNTISKNIAGGVYLYSSDRVTVMSNDISQNGHGIFLDWTTNDTVRANTFTSDGIYMRGTSIPHFNSHTITLDNQVNGKPVYYYKNCSGLTVDGTILGQLLVSNCTDVNVLNLRINDTDVGVELGFVEGASVTSNRVSDSNFGIVLWHSRNATIADNDIWNHGYGINPWFSTNVTIAENDLSTNYTNLRGSGLYPFRSTNITISNNTISRSGNGVRVHNSDNISISNNELLSNGEGVRSESSFDIMISDNHISDQRTGIRSFSSTDITITGNDILDNDYWGIRFQGGADISITGNSIVSSGIGIDLTGASPVLVHHNSLIDNTPQAYDDVGTENSWDDGYPSGGNYWSDYAGIDNCSGPNQDICPDPDGIGDSPYVIDANSMDIYPLMSPPVFLPALPPTVLGAALAGGNSENIHLTWSLSPDDGMRLKSVIGYNVYRNTSYDPEGLDYQSIASLPNGTSEFTDISAGEGNPNNYFYQVCAVDAIGNTTCAPSQGSKFTRLLLPGSNLVSIPLIPSNESIETVLQTVEYDKAWFYDSPSQEWRWSMTSKTYRRGLWSMNQTMGLWVNVTGDCNLTVAGIVPAQTSIHLQNGWNLVGFPSFNSSYSVYDLKMDMGVERVEGYNSLPPHYLRILGDGEVLQVGYGYWVRVEVDTIWTVSIQ